MQANQYKYLKFVRFQELDNWSARYMINRQVLFNHKFQLNKLSSFLTKGGTITTIDDNGKYKRITVKTKNGGVCLRDIVTGKNIGTKKQWLVSEGLFIISKIDARNGAMGIIPKELNGTIVTNDFPVFNIDKGSIVPQYLLLVTTTERFVEFVQKCSSGTTNRQRVDVNDFLDVKIPIPSLSEQQALVEAYNAKIKTAEEKERRAEQLNNEIEDYLLSELGASVSKTQIAKGLNFVHFKDISRWDVQFFTSTIKTKSKFHKTTLARCINNFMNDKNGHSLRRETYKSPNQEFRYIGMESVEKETGFLLDLPIVKGSEVKSQTIEVPAGYFIYGKLRPYLNKYWLNETDDSNIVCSSEFFVFDVKQDINRLFFKYVLSSGIVQKQISDATSGARMPRINETVFKNICIPLPPIGIQNTIVKHITELKEQIKQLKQESKELRENALVEFEKEIFE